MKWIKNKPKKDKTKWHKWFAYKPVEVRRNPDGSIQVRFLTFVERRGRWHIPKVPMLAPYWEWEYREIVDYRHIVEDIKTPSLSAVSYSTATPFISGEAHIPPPEIDHTTRLWYPPPSQDYEIEPSEYDVNGCKDCDLYQKDEWNRKLTKAAHDVVEDMINDPDLDEKLNSYMKNDSEDEDADWGSFKEDCEKTTKEHPVDKLRRELEVKKARKSKTIL